MPKQSYIATVEGQVWVQETVRYLGLTQEQIADQANLKTRTSVGKLINGKRVERGAFKRICKCLGLDYTAIAGLTLPSLPTASSTESSSAESQVSGGEAEEVLRQLGFLQDEVSGLRVDIYILREQNARPSQRIALGEEASDSTISVQEIPDASALKEQDEVLAKRPLEGAGSDQRSLHTTWEPGSRDEVQIPLGQGGKVEDQIIKPNIKIGKVEDQIVKPNIKITEQITSLRFGPVPPSPRVEITQPPTLPCSGDTNPRQVSAVHTSGEMPSPNVGSTRDDHSHLSKPIDQDPKKDKRKRGLFNR